MDLKLPSQDFLSYELFLLEYMFLNFAFIDLANDDFWYYLLGKWNLNLGSVNFWFYKNLLASEGEWERLRILLPSSTVGLKLLSAEGVSSSS